MTLAPDFVYKDGPWEGWTQAQHDAWYRLIFPHGTEFNNPRTWERNPFGLPAGYVAGQVINSNGDPTIYCGIAPDGSVSS